MSRKSQIREHIEKDCFRYLDQKESKIAIMVSLEDLETLFEKVVSKAKSELEEEIIEQKVETYLSVKKVAEILDVNESTLYRWRNTGYMVPIGLGSKRRYKMSDVNKILGRR